MRYGLILLLAVGTLWGVFAMAGTVPSGAQYYVDESNGPLILAFNDLKGELSFNLNLQTDGNPADAPWDAYLVYAGTKELEGKIVQHMEFNQSYPGWVYMTVTDPALQGDVYLRFVIDDFEPASNALAAVRNFSSAAIYISGGTAAP